MRSLTGGSGQSLGPFAATRQGDIGWWQPSDGVTLLPIDDSSMGDSATDGNVSVRGRARLLRGADSHLNDLGSQGWEAVGLSLKSGDLFDWPVVLLKRAMR
jgi:hypothetical protein